MRPSVARSLLALVCRIATGCCLVQGQFIRWNRRCAGQLRLATVLRSVYQTQLIMLLMTAVATQKRRSVQSHSWWCQPATALLLRLSLILVLLAELVRVTCVVMQALHLYR
jgi:hypothetical protein